jgi:hypothetical protein
MSLQTTTRRLELGGDASLRYAMLSIYYGSVGRQLELQGAPAVLLPPEVRPLTLDEALGYIKESHPGQFPEAVWRVVRAFRPASGADALERCYPRALIKQLGRDKLARLNELRRSYRLGANLFAAALVACASDNQAEFEELQRLLAGQAGRESGSVRDFSLRAAGALGRPAPEYLDAMRQSDDWAEAAKQVTKLEQEVSLNLYDFTEGFADAVAFMTFCQDDDDWRWNGGGATVYPVSTVIQQYADSLITSATATTVVQGDFETLCRAVDPRCWCLCSRVIKRIGVVVGPFDLDPLPADDLPPIGQSWGEETRFLHEHAEVSWGLDPNQQGFFDNVLAVRFSVWPEKRSVNVDFSLSRSIASRILWDQRAGGMLINNGYIKVRPLLGAEDRWRVTRRKTLKFSDRTPYANGPGWLDVGEMLNYLAPSALAWWLESDMYSDRCPMFASDDEIGTQPCSDAERGR